MSAWLKFPEAREWARKQQFAGRSAWDDACAKGTVPPDVPHEPWGVYKDEWISWDEWLGASNCTNPATFEQADGNNGSGSGSGSGEHGNCPPTDQGGSGSGSGSGRTNYAHNSRPGAEPSVVDDARKESGSVRTDSGSGGGAGVVDGGLPQVEDGEKKSDSEQKSVGTGAANGNGAAVVPPLSSSLNGGVVSGGSGGSQDGVMAPSGAVRMEPASGSGGSPLMSPDAAVGIAPRSASPSGGTGRGGSGGMDGPVVQLEQGSGQGSDGNGGQLEQGSGQGSDGNAGGLQAAKGGSIKDQSDGSAGSAGDGDGAGDRGAPGGATAVPCRRKRSNSVARAAAPRSQGAPRTIRSHGGDGRDRGSGGDDNAGAFQSDIDTRSGGTGNGDGDHDAGSGCNSNVSDEEEGQERQDKKRRLSTQANDEEKQEQEQQTKSRRASTRSGGTSGGVNGRSGGSVEIIRKRHSTRSTRPVRSGDNSGGNSNFSGEGQQGRTSGSAGRRPRGEKDGSLSFSGDDGSQQQADDDGGEGGQAADSELQNNAGSGRVSPSASRYLPYEEARKWIQAKGVKTANEWREMCRKKQLPPNIPGCPYRIYKNEWVSWGEWLGTGTKARMTRTYLPFEEAQEWARQQGLQNQREWFQLCKSRKLPYLFPTNPNRTYKDKGWISWGHWLGSGHKARASKSSANRKAAAEAAAAAGGGGAGAGGRAPPSLAEALPQPDQSGGKAVKTEEGAAGAESVEKAGVVGDSALAVLASGWNGIATGALPGMGGMQGMQGIGAMAGMAGMAGSMGGMQGIGPVGHLAGVSSPVSGGAQLNYGDFNQQMLNLQQAANLQALQSRQLGMASLGLGGIGGMHGMSPLGLAGISDPTAASLLFPGTLGNPSPFGNSLGLGQGQVQGLDHNAAAMQEAAYRQSAQNVVMQAVLQQMSGQNSQVAAQISAVRQVAAQQAAAQQAAVQQAARLAAGAGLGGQNNLQGGNNPFLPGLGSEYNSFPFQ